MVKRGDTVQVTIPTYLTGMNTYAGARSGLQNRLRTAGFDVLGTDDSALSYFGALGQRGQLIVTVVPTTSDYASPHDVGAIVAGAAYVNGYDINAGQTSIVIAQAGSAAEQYRDLQNRPDVQPPENPNSLSDFFNDLTGSPVTLAVIAGAAVLLVIAAKK